MHASPSPDAAISERSRTRVGSPRALNVRAIRSASSGVSTPPVTGEQHEPARRLVDGLDDDGLDDALLTDRVRELSQVAEVLTGVIGIRVDQADGERIRVWECRNSEHEAEKVAAELRQFWSVDYDTSGAIGRRYRRQDEIGTPFCVTVDFDTLEDNAVTVRERDTMAQERISLSELQAYLAQRLIGC